eukprot:GFUD01044354.1.p1 GENE.GFUD01044354.1~~GFUD01044354.1.p1  ORF type:complete len:126 (-),score=34.80 GFUD01044354.1:35-412(-)
MRLGDILKIGWILITVPVSLSVWLLINVANIIAPDLTFKFMQKKMKMKGLGSKTFESTSDFGFMLSLDMVKNMASNQIRDILKEAQHGCSAPNPTMVDLSTKTSTSLLSLAKVGRPLVVNFGSCT